MSIEDLQEQFRAFKEETDRKLAALQNENDTLKASLDGVLSKIAPVNGTSTLPRPNTASRAKTPSKPSARPGSSDPARRNSIGNGPRGLKPSASKEAVGDSGSVDNVVKGKAPGTIGKRSAALKEQKIEIDEKRIGSSQVGKRKVFYVTPADYVKSSEEDQPPAEDLKLEYIFGFNGKAARNNLFYTNKDQGATSLLYCVAATGVTYDIPSDSQKFFNGHNEDILCLAIHPNRPIAATGQLDPKGSGKPFTCVWDYSTMQQLARIENFHDRGVCAVAFSRDGKQLISVGNDDSHTAAVWDWESDVKKPVASGMIAKDEVYGIAVNPHNEKLEFAAFGSKLLKHFVLAPSESKSNNAPAFTIKGTILSSFKNTKVVQSAFHSALFTKGGDLVVGTTTGSVYMFKNNTYSKSIDSHKGKVGALVELPEGFASAGDDAVLTLYGADGSVTGTLELGKYKARSMDYANVNGGKFIIGTSNNHIIEMSVEEKKFNIVSEGHSNELWGLATHPTEPVFVTCSNDKTLRTWDLTTKKPVPNKFLAFKEEAICTAFSPDGKTVAVGHLSGKVTLVDWDSFTVKYEKKHRQEQISSIAFSPNGQLVAVGSWDQMAELIDLESKSSVTLKGHTSSVTHLTFSEDSKFLVTNSRDYEILFWNTETGKRVDKAVTADVKWYEWSCILGFPVKGIFGKDQDGTDNNAAHVSYGQKLVVTGNDTGEVALFRYPASSKAIKKFVGHSAHVTNVKFTRDDKHVISTGGNDTGIFLWRVGSE